MSDSLQLYGLYSTRLLYLWDSSGKNTGSGLLCSPPVDLPDLGIEPVSPALQADSLLLSHWGSPSLDEQQQRKDTLIFRVPCMTLL